MGRTPTLAAVPRLAHLGPAIAWLRDRGVPIRVLADAFGASAQHVAVLDWRARHDARRILRPRVGALASDSLAGLATRSDWLDDELEGIRLAYERLGDFGGGLQALATFRPQLGRPHTMRLVRLLARWHEHRAWFAVHSGFTRSAILSSWAARTLSQQVYRESLDPFDLRRLGDAALIGAHAHLYINEPAQSLGLLTLFREATEARSGALGSDYYRQLGIAYALQGRGESGASGSTADRVLAHVPVVMERCGEATTAEQLTFATRQRYLLGRRVNVDGCGQILHVVRDAFRPESLEAVIAAHYYAAAALTTDPSGHRFADGLKWLERSRARAVRFPHQAAVTYLLETTPRLRLDSTLRRSWVQQVWYLNPHRRS